MYIIWVPKCFGLCCNLQEVMVEVIALPICFVKVLFKAILFLKYGNFCYEKRPTFFIKTISILRIQILFTYSTMPMLSLELEIPFPLNWLSMHVRICIQVFNSENIFFRLELWIQLLAFEVNALLEISREVRNLSEILR